MSSGYIGKRKDEKETVMGKRQEVIGDGWNETNEINEMNQINEINENNENMECRSLLLRRYYN